MQRLALGSIRYVLNAEGEPEGYYLYDAFGETITTEGIISRLKYNAQIEDELSGLYYLRARYYNPVIYCDPSGLAATNPSGGLPCNEKTEAENANPSMGSESGIKTVNGYDAIVNVGQQNKHIPGTNEYKNALNNGQTRSILYGDTNDIQNLLNQKAGTSNFLGTNKERVNFGKVIGQYIDPNTGIGVETTMGIIHYGKKGAHIVPARPN